MTLKDIKCKYDDEKVQVSIATSKRRRPFGDDDSDDDSSLEEQVVTPRVSNLYD
jgi:hypothetical protein